MIGFQSDGINLAVRIKKEWTILLFALINLLPRRLDAQPTTPFIKEIMIGRCLDYQYTNQQQFFANGQTKNCTQLWLEFRHSFADRPPCSSSLEDFSTFIDSAYIPVPKNKAILWTGTAGTVKQYASNGQRFYTVDATLTGYMVNDINFCGQKAFPGLNYNTCPGWTECDGVAARAFWSAASKKFAKGIEGVVPVILNGTSGAAYRNNSIFTLIELPNLDNKKVTLIKAHLIHRMGQPKRETCDTGTMVQLKEDAMRLGFKYTCTENPSDIMHLMCVDNVNAPECREMSEILGCTSTAQALFVPSFNAYIVFILGTKFMLQHHL